MSTKLKVVMFADRVKSTQRMKSLTPEEIRQICDEQNEFTARVVSQYRGEMFDSGYRGDGHLIQFSSCRDAVLCGFILQQCVRARNEAQTNDRLKLELHIGVDFGEVAVWPDGDLQGNAVNRAARVCSECPPGEVYFTAKVMKELNLEEAKIAEVGPVKLKDVGRINLYSLKKWTGAELLPRATQPSPNPFIWRKGITKAEDFFDRDNEQKTIRSYLGGSQNCQIVGPRRIGKTSLLLQIQRVASQWERSSVVAYLDLQDPRCFTLPGWLEIVSREFEWDSAPTNLVQFADCVESVLSKGHKPVLCLDEFEELTSRSDEFTRDFFLTLRSCGQKGLSIITTSRDLLSELTESGDPSSPFYNTFPILRLDVFLDEDAEDFVTLRRPGVPPFTPDEREEILKFANGRPLALQVACFHVLQAKESSESLVTALRKAEDDMSAAWR